LKTKLTPEITKAICKKLKTGTYAKIAAESEGITERSFYRYIERGEEALKLAEKGIKYPESEEIYCQFCQSVRQSTAEVKAVLKHVKLREYPALKEIFVQFVQSVRGVMIKCKFLLVAKVILNKVERLATFINGILRRLIIQGASLDVLFSIIKFMAS